MNYFNISFKFFNTIIALVSLYFLLKSNSKIWFSTGAFIGLFWFWWISLSLIQYEYSWGIPIAILVLMLIYAILFYIPAKLSEKSSSLPIQLTIKSLSLIAMSYIHPFGFDWLKPELIFIESYIGILKWQFIIVLLVLNLFIIYKKTPILIALLLTFNIPKDSIGINNNIELVTTHTKISDKWNKSLHETQFKEIYNHIDQAIENKKSIIVLPESVFPIFLNKSKKHIETLKVKSKKITIILGALYLDNYIPKNSTYIFKNGNYEVASKVILVPFGEANPLPDFLSNIVNDIFYDGAVDYVSHSKTTDYKVNNITYRNAICFEATSEALYDKNVKNMIVLSNNGWFTPSIQPTLQKLLLQYYSKKYNTTIYHSINLSKSYIIQNGKEIKEQN